MRKTLPSHDNYYSDLITVIKEFDDISEGSLQDILRISLDDPKTANAKLLEIAPAKFIQNIIEKVQRTEDGLELILLAEEFKT